jgi:hypothetical protein
MKVPKLSLILALFIGCMGMLAAMDAIPCNLQISRLVEKKGKLSFVIRVDNVCRGMEIHFFSEKEYGKAEEIAVFAANLQDHIVQNAPPFGFSLRRVGESDFHSLGVDAHILQEYNRSIILDPSTKTDQADKEHIAIRWIFDFLEPSKISRLYRFRRRSGVGCKPMALRSIVVVAR